MGFRRLVATALDTRHSAGYRYRALQGMVERYATLTNTSYMSVMAELTDQAHLTHGSASEPAALSEAAQSLAEARAHFIRSLADFRTRRQVRKRHGRRSPELDELVELEHSIELGRARISSNSRAG